MSCGLFSTCGENMNAEKTHRVLVYFIDALTNHNFERAKIIASPNAVKIVAQAAKIIAENKIKNLPEPQFNCKIIDRKINDNKANYKLQISVEGQEIECKIPLVYKRKTWLIDVTDQEENSLNFIASYGRTPKLEKLKEESLFKPTEEYVCSNQK